jgi:short-subunit dehydrogenase
MKRMTSEEFRLKYGPVALVTGASSGIGWAFAEALARRGFDLVLTARRVDRLEALAARLAQNHGVKTRIVGADLTDLTAPAKILDATDDLDVGLVVSNAGFNMKGAHETKSASSLTKLLMVNCHAPMHLAHGFIPRLKARGKGGIIFTSSVEGFIGNPYSTAYSASKALVNALGEGLWAELAGTGVDVLTLCPGATESEATTQRGPGGRVMQDLQPADEVARLGLDNIANGPTLIPREDYKAMYDRLLAQPRREALMTMAEGVRQYWLAR